MIRRTIFWLHLGCGVAVGLVIALMSVTGVILTYERQILDWVESSRYAVPTASGPRLELAALVDAVERGEPGFDASTVTIASRASSAVVFAAGRDGIRYVNPYTAEVLGRGATGLRAFFSAVTGWHRWFNASGENRAPWRAITGASNLAFLFLVLSGIYLWLPGIFSRAAFRIRLWFNPRATGGKARDYNWHHVFGIWSALPLAVIVATAVVFSYSWANALLYTSFGEQPPQRRGPPTAQAGTTARGAGSELAGYVASAATAHAPLNALVSMAALQRPGWQSMTLQLPSPEDATVRFTLDRGNGGQPQLRDTLLLDARSAEVVEWQPFAAQTDARRARSWVRYLHTGEALGILGQTIAGLVSAFSVLMVWTGLALAWRRLVLPLLRR